MKHIIFKIVVFSVLFNFNSWASDVGSKEPISDNNGQFAPSHVLYPDETNQKISSQCAIAVKEVEKFREPTRVASKGTYCVSNLAGEE